MNEKNAKTPLPCPAPFPMDPVPPVPSPPQPSPPALNPILEITRIFDAAIRRERELREQEEVETSALEDERQNRLFEIEAS